MTVTPAPQLGDCCCAGHAGTAQSNHTSTAGKLAKDHISSPTASAAPLHHQQGPLAKQATTEGVSAPDNKAVSPGPATAVSQPATVAPSRGGTAAEQQPASASPLVALPASTAAPSLSCLGAAALRQAVQRVKDAAGSQGEVTEAPTLVSQNPTAADHIPVSARQKKSGLSASSFNLWKAQTRRLQRSHSASTTAAAAASSLPPDPPAGGQPQRSESLPSSPLPRQPLPTAALSHQQASAQAGHQAVPDEVTAASRLSPIGHPLPVTEHVSRSASGLAGVGAEQHKGLDSAPTSPQTLRAGVLEAHRRQLLQQDSSKRRYKACMAHLKTARLDIIKWLRVQSVVGIPFTGVLSHTVLVHGWGMKADLLPIVNHT